MTDDYDDHDTHGFDDDGEASTEALVWQLLCLINPGDEETALQEFATYRDLAAEADPEGFEPMAAIGHAIDWRSGFMVDEGDTRALVQAIDELAARWHVAVDWGGDPHDDDFHEVADAAELCVAAHASLAEHGYTLWLRDADAGAVAGWMTLERDRAAMRELAAILRIDLWLGSQAA